MADEVPIQKIAISGPTLASIIQRFASSHGDVDGLLFGHVTRLPSPELHDDNDPSAAAPAPLAAVVTGHFCSGAPSSFYDSLGRVDRRSLLRSAHGGHGSVVGWFSGRRRSPLRPSMREHAVSLSLAETLTLTLADRSSSGLVSKPCVFLLLSSSATANEAMHTHEYRGFVLGSRSLEPRSLDLVNIGPSFRAQYSSFSPESSFPLVPCQLRGGQGESEDDNRQGLRVSDQQSVDSAVEGFGMERLMKLVGPGAAGYSSELEDFYGKMLQKLESLARQVEKSSAKLVEQEDLNLMLRSKLSGLE